MPRLGEIEFATAAHAVHAGQRSTTEFFETLLDATVYLAAPPRPGVYEVEIPRRGRWVLVFSSVERLGAYYGACDWLSMLGTELFSLRPDGLGLLLDPGDEHAIAAPAEMLTVSGRVGHALSQHRARMQERMPQQPRPESPSGRRGLGI